MYNIYDREPDNDTVDLSTNMHLLEKQNEEILVHIQTSSTSLQKSLRALRSEVGQIKSSLPVHGKLGLAQPHQPLSGVIDLNQAHLPLKRKIIARPKLFEFRKCRNAHDFGRLEALLKLQENMQKFVSSNFSISNQVNHISIIILKFAAGPEQEAEILFRWNHTGQRDYSLMTFFRVTLNTYFADDLLILFSWVTLKDANKISIRFSNVFRAIEEAGASVSEATTETSRYNELKAALVRAKDCIRSRRKSQRDPDGC